MLKRLRLARCTTHSIFELAEFSNADLNRDRTFRMPLVRQYIFAAIKRMYPEIEPEIPIIRTSDAIFEKAKGHLQNSDSIIGSGAAFNLVNQIYFLFT